MISEDFLRIFEFLAYAATLLGIPIALYILYKEKRKERLDREYGTYDVSNQKYLDYLMLCLERPQLDVFDVPIDREDARPDDPDRVTLIMFNILIAIMERAFLLYRERSTAMRRAQWTGWVEYMEMWASRTHFQRGWEILGPQFDRDFVAFVNAIIIARGGAVARPWSPMA